jgi:predicted RNase H-like HicB family nuclease
MVYKVALHRSEEGYSVTVPGLPGCCSQADTEEEALDNIADAIREYLEVAAELAAEAEGEVREVVIPE